MIKLNDNDIMRDGVKIGWVTKNHFFNSSGKKVGYATLDKIYDENAVKLAHVDGEYVYYNTADGKKTKIETLIEDIAAPYLSNVQRVAIRMFFGN